MKCYASNEFVPHFAMLSFMQGTKLDIIQRSHWDGMAPLKQSTITMHLNVGDLLIVQGGVVHRGSSYNSVNYRLHMYILGNHLARVLNVATPGITTLNSSNTKLPSKTTFGRGMRGKGMVKDVTKTSMYASLLDLKKNGDIVRVHWISGDFFILRQHVFNSLDLVMKDQRNASELRAEKTLFRRCVEHMFKGVTIQDTTTQVFSVRVRHTYVQGLLLKSNGVFNQAQEFMSTKLHPLNVLRCRKGLPSTMFTWGKEQYLCSDLRGVLRSKVHCMDVVIRQTARGRSVFAKRRLQPQELTLPYFGAIRWNT